MKRVRLAIAGAAAALLSTAPMTGAAFAQGSSEQSVEARRQMFLEDEVAPRHQPARYDVTIVKYTDYQCPFCRKAHGDLKKLVQEDSRVRILYRDWPIFGEASEEAARLAIASKWQGEHAQFHDALMKSAPPLSTKSIRAAADAAGVNWTRLQADLKAHKEEIESLLQRNEMQANSLGLQGTPVFIVGNTLVEGAVDLAEFKELVAEARAETRRK